MIKRQSIIVTTFVFLVQLVLPFPLSDLFLVGGLVLLPRRRVFIILIVAQTIRGLRFVFLQFGLAMSIIRPMIAVTGAPTVLGPYLAIFSLVGGQIVYSSLSFGWILFIAWRLKVYRIRAMIPQQYL